MAVGRQKSIIFPAVGALLALNNWLAVVRPRSMDRAPGDVCHVDHPAARFNRAILSKCVAIHVVDVTLTARNGGSSSQS